LFKKAGIVIGSVAGAALIAFGVWYYLKKKK
jgi:LPXTG-motif cell wall-anchored protein